MIVTIVTIESHPHSSQYILLVYCVLPSYSHHIIRKSTVVIQYHVEMCSCFNLPTYYLLVPTLYSQLHHLSLPPVFPINLTAPWRTIFLVPGLYNGRSPYLTFIILVNCLPGPYAYVPQLESIHRNLSSSH